MRENCPTLKKKIKDYKTEAYKERWKFYEINIHYGDEIFKKKKSENDWRKIIWEKSKFAMENWRRKTLYLLKYLASSSIVVGFK